MELFNESLDEIYPFTRIKPKYPNSVFDEWEFEVNSIMHVVRFTRTDPKLTGTRVCAIDFGIRKGKIVRRKIESVGNIRKYLATVLKIVETALEDPTMKMKMKSDEIGRAHV